MAAWRYEISLFNTPPTLEEKLEEKFSAVSPRGHVISCLYIFLGSANYAKLVRVRGNFQGRPWGVVVYQYNRKKFAKIP